MKKQEITIYSFDKHINDLKNKNLIVLHGDERYFFDLFLKKIEDTIFRDKAEKDLNFHLFSGLENSVSEILAACLSFPMLADKKMVIVKDFDKLKIDNKDNFLKYVQHPQPSTVLVLIAERLSNIKFHLDIMNLASSIKCRSLSNEEIYNWTNAKFRKANIKANKACIAFLIENIGNNLLRLNLEIEKIINYIGPEKSLTLDIVSQLTGFTRDVNIFNFQRSLASRNLSASLKIGLQLIEQGDALAAILPMLFIFFRRLWVVKYLITKDYTQNQILQKLSGSKYAYLDIFSSIENFSYQHLMVIMDKLEEAEMQLKTSQKSNDSILTMLCFYICHS